MLTGKVMGSRERYEAFLGGMDDLKLLLNICDIGKYRLINRL